MTEAKRIAENFESFAIDHGPLGWPAIKQKELTEAATELRRLSALLDQHRHEVHHAYQRGSSDGYARGLADGRMNPQALHAKMEAQRTYIPKRRSDWPVLESAT
jgi:flagellar biosynthesis/type III secretory pathway protein FliH